MLNASVPEQQIHFLAERCTRLEQIHLYWFCIFHTFLKIYSRSPRRRSQWCVAREKARNGECLYYVLPYTQPSFQWRHPTQSFSSYFPSTGYNKKYIYSIRKLWMQSATYISIESFKFPTTTTSTTEYLGRMVIIAASYSQRHGFDLGSETDYPDRFSWFFSEPPCNCRGML